ncbi:DUF167 domain-containing protein [Patescibacteria group bacterium]|nr:DUF167 domain-containing protein [Patescibacteria group bacterium]MCG2695177.1 DUF167 domain-containing protein [Candidatus Parcubacteria bacterium]
MYIKVRVYPKSKKEEFKKLKVNKFEIRVKEKAERNMANTRVVDILAEYFKIGRGKVKLVAGHQSPSKMFSIGIDE